MSTFESLEESLESSRPVELYTFVLGAEEFRYAASEDAITIGSETWDPTPISRGSVAQGRDESRRPIDIKMRADTAFAERWKTRAPGVQTSVSVFRVQRDESPSITTKVLEFKGIVRKVDYPEFGDVATVAAASIQSLAQSTVPRYRYSGSCNHFLYGPGCGVDPAPHTFTGTVSAQSGLTLTVPGAGAFSTKFPSGFVRPVSFTDFRMIRAQATDVITINFPFPFDMVGQQVDLVKGCDRLVAGDCDTEYGNVIENGGFNGVPLANPFEEGLRA